MTACTHLRAVVEALEQRGHRRLTSWCHHRNDMVYTAFLAPHLDPGDLVTLAPATLRTGGNTGCYRADHSHVWCSCEQGAYCAVLLAQREAPS